MKRVPGEAEKASATGKQAACFPIVGVGASAGGLHALQSFLNALPEVPGCALVFVQHLSSTHPSHLVELLRSRRPDFEIHEISDGDEIRPGHLHVCPPRVEARVSGGGFRVHSVPQEGIPRPVDTFLTSLAEAAGPRAIAVILSGGGTDGARGVQAVHNLGGTVFAQAPETAEFAGMPLAAIATGHVDAVLAPPEIAREIQRLLCSPWLRLLGSADGGATRRSRRAVPLAPEPLSSVPARHGTGTEPRQSLTDSILQTLLEEYVPAAVAVGPTYDIIYHNGPTHRYLQHPRGAPTVHLLDLVPEGLRTRLRGACHRCSRDGTPSSLRASFSCGDARKRTVTLRVSRLRDDVLLVAFRERGHMAYGEGGTSPPEEAGVQEATVNQLEGELAWTRAELQSQIERLRTVNEELLAANEQQETTHEELQCLNEELLRVNAQLQVKIEEQDVVNDDLHNLLTSTSIPTLFLDRGLRLRRYTPATARLMQFLPSDVGRPILDLSQEALGSGFIADAQAVLETHAPVKREALVKDAWYVRTALPYCSSHQGLDGVVVTYADVTDQKVAEARMRHLASFPQLNPNLLVEVSRAGEVTYANPATHGILRELGLGEGDIWLLLPPDLSDLVAGLASQAEALLLREIEVHGRIFLETVCLVPRFDVVRIYGQDITSLVGANDAITRLNRELAKRNEELEILNRELEAFIYSISHDLRAPLRAIAGFSTFLGEEHTSGLDELGRSYLDRIRGSAENMASFIDGLLAMARISRQALEPAPVDLSLLATTTLADLAARHPGRRVQICVEPGLMVTADPRLMEIALAQLLANAWKFTSRTDSAQIAFGALEDQGRRVFFVRDNGVGFDAAHADKLFAPFQRLHADPDVEGAGIGLTLVERVIRRHGGRVWAEGAVEKGAVVYFTTE